MAKKSADTWQPLLLDLGQPKPPPPPEEKPERQVEYDRGVIRRRPPPASSNDDAPWWQRVKQLEQDPVRAVQPVLSWGASWQKMIAGEGWLEGLRAGQRMVLENSVRGLDIRAGVVEAASGGGKTKPQRVQIRMAPLTSAEWARLIRQVIDDGADTASCAALEAGQIPLALVDAADRHGVPLLPRRLALLLTACTCGGAQLPCDHVLAVHLGVARKLDAEPLAVLAFRGGVVSELLELFARVREELQALARTPAAPIAQDPLKPGEGPPPEWGLLSLPPPAKAPLPVPEGWRARETLDALVRRLLAAVRKQL